MASEMTADEIFDRNPNLDRDKIEDALRIVGELHDAGVRSSRFRLASPYDRHSLRHSADSGDDEVAGRSLPLGLA